MLEEVFGPWMTAKTRTSADKVWREATPEQFWGLRYGWLWEALRVGVAAARCEYRAKAWYGTRQLQWSRHAHTGFFMDGDVCRTVYGNEKGWRMFDA